MPNYSFDTSCCPVCASPCAAEKFTNAPVEFACTRCGRFEIDLEAHQTLGEKKISARQIANLSGYVRENQGICLTGENIERFCYLRTPSVGEKAAKLLLAIAREWPVPGQNFHINYWNAAVFEALHEENSQDLRWLAMAWAQDNGELEYLLRKFLQDQGFLATGMADTDFIVTPKGWGEIFDIQTKGPKSVRAFVAMSFQPEFRALFDNALFPGIGNAGYLAFRVDRHEHNNRIDDEIVASIQQSKFLVADFTVDRGGIYSTSRRVTRWDSEDP